MLRGRWRRMELPTLLPVRVEAHVAVDVGKFRAGGVANTIDPEGIELSWCESGSGGAWSSGVAEEEGVAVCIADEEIKITVAVDIGKSRAWGAANTIDPEGIAFSCGEIGSCREAALAAGGPGGSWRGVGGLR